MGRRTRSPETTPSRLPECTGRYCSDQNDGTVTYGVLTPAALRPGDRAVILRVAPVFQAHGPMRPGKPYHVPGRIDRRVRRSAAFVDDDAVVDRESAAAAAMPDIGRDAGADDDEIRGDDIASAGHGFDGIGVERTMKPAPYPRGS